MPTKADRKRIDAAVTSFHTYYSSPANWGTERWRDTLYPALCQPTRYAALVNQYVAVDEVEQLLSGNQATTGKLAKVRLPRQNVLQPVADQDSNLTIFEHTLLTGDSSAADPGPPATCLFPPPIPKPSLSDPSQSLLSHWNLDAASALCAHFLDVHPSDRVLDLCAAPGGKSIALAQSLFSPSKLASSAAQAKSSPPATSCLHSNEIDAPRNRRLKNNLRSYLPTHLFASLHIKTFAVDGTDAKAASLFPYGQGGYDRVLLDAPCSSERHIIHAQSRAAMSGNTADEMARWRPGSSKNMAKTQLALLITAIKAVKAGGRVVYSTCSISTEENDGVIEKMLLHVQKDNSKGHYTWHVMVELGREGVGRDSVDQVRLDELSEETKYGRIVVPDHPGGDRWGPLFFSVLTKTASGDGRIVATNL